MNQIYADSTGQPLSVIEATMERDSFMSAEEALEFGLIDHVITTRPEALKVEKPQKD